jgi:hypothetical protein
VLLRWWNSILLAGALLIGAPALSDAPIHTLASKENLHLMPAGELRALSQALVEFWMRLDESTQSGTDPHQVFEHGSYRAQARWVPAQGSQEAGSLVLEVRDLNSQKVFLSSFDSERAPQLFSGLQTLRFDPRTLGVMDQFGELAQVTDELARAVPLEVSDKSLDEILGPLPTRLQELRSVWDADDLETLNQVMESGSQLVRKWQESEKAFTGSEHNFLYDVVKKGGVIHKSSTGTAELNWIAGQYFIRVKNERTQELFILHSGLNFEDPQVKTLISGYKIAAGQDRPDGQTGRDMNFIFIQDLQEKSEKMEADILNPANFKRELRSTRFASLAWWSDYWRYIKGSTTRETLKADFKFGSFCGAFQGATAACAAGLKEALNAGTGFRWDSILLSMGWGTGIGTIAGPWQRFVGLGSTTVRSVKSTANSLAFYYSLMLLGQGGNVSAFFNFADAFWPTVMLHLATVGPSFARNVARVYWNNFVIIREAAGITRDKTWNLRLWPFKRVWQTGFKEARVDAQIRFYIPSFFLGLVDSFFHTPFSWATIPIVELGAKEYARHLADTMEKEQRPGWMKARELSNRMEKAYDRRMLTLFGSDQKFFKLKLKRMAWNLRRWIPGDSLGVRLRANPKLFERLEAQIAQEPSLDVQTLRLKRLYSKLVGDQQTADEIGELLNKNYPGVFQYVSEADKKAFHAVRFNLPNDEALKRLSTPKVPTGCVDSLRSFLSVLPAAS